MSNEPLEEYKKLYSEYIALAVNVHNYHLTFINNLGLESSVQVRNSLAKMIQIERRLRILCKDARNVFVEQTKEERKRLKELRAKAKKREMPKNRKGGPEWVQQNKSNNNTKTS